MTVINFRHYFFNSYKTITNKTHIFFFYKNYYFIKKAQKKENIIILFYFIGLPRKPRLSFRNKYKNKNTPLSTILALNKRVFQGK